MLVTDYLEAVCNKYAKKTAFADTTREITFGTLRDEALHVAKAIADTGIFKQPVAIFLDKSVECISSFMGALYSGNFYSPIDTLMPEDRIIKITQALNPAIIVTDRRHFDQAKSFSGNTIILVYEEILLSAIKEQEILSITEKVLDTDVCYVLFTSGSTGIPKGVIIPHKAVVDFTEWGVESLGTNDQNIWGNQTPFYFSMSVFDIYQTIRTGATMYIIPRELFSLPGELMKYLEEKKVDSIFWVPSALIMVSALHALNCPHLDRLKNVFFGGEVMPMKQLNRWRAEYPDVRFINFYGPTEVTDTCTIYEVNRQFADTETLPMGRACKNTDVFLLDENDQRVENGIGEVCVRGTGLAYGYYNAPEKTAEVFVQNPQNREYPEVIYRTGDLATINEYGEFVYVGRKDFQIKHMGHRVELGEIEAIANSIAKVKAACCLYDQKHSIIYLFYSGDIHEGELMTELKKNLPSYMLPGRRVLMDELPRNLNGKIDRQKLKELIRS